jgi:hypothetical protein
MGDAQVPPEPSDARTTPARRQALRLSDTEDVAATRLDMFGDPSLKEALVGQPASPGDRAVPLSAAEGAADAPQPEEAADDGARSASLDASRPLSLPPPGVLHAFDAGVTPVEAGEQAPDAVAQPASADLPEMEAHGAEPAPAAPAPHAAAEAPRTLSALDAAGQTPQEANRKEEAAQTARPFSFMMPPGLPDQEALDMAAGPLNEQPRFRDELMIVKDSASDAIVVDATVLPDMGPSPSHGLPQDPPFTESDAQPQEDLPAAPPFSAFSDVPPYPEAGPTFDEASSFSHEPEPPPSSPFFDAAAKIAAEANATAEALDNLKRLLDQKLPHLQPVETAYRTDPSGERIVPAAMPAGGPGQRMYAEPPPFMSHAPAPLLPLPVPPPRASARGVYLLGFLTGLALSLMAGGVLYFFIAHISPG